MGFQNPSSVSVYFYRLCHKVCNLGPRILICAPFLVAFVPADTYRELDPLDVFGTWLSPAGDVAITFKQCDPRPLCGDISWVDNTKAKVQSDSNNPEPSLRTRSLVGLRVLWDFKAAEDSWIKGKIYDYSSGRVFASKVTRTGQKSVKIEMCRIFCRARRWSRVSVKTEELSEAVFPSDLSEKLSMPKLNSQPRSDMG